MTSEAPALTIPSDASPENLLEGFLAHVEAKGLELYPAQEEAILSLFGGDHVILTTPTGSGKSLVAEALHYASLARRERSFYTAPIKALVSEKFFALCRTFGAENVGMMTGDASINRDAPILCCTAEILANVALLEGAGAHVGTVVMDEFHYYADRDRGVAWQVPLLELPRTQFLLMSATLGDTSFFETDLRERTGRTTTVVSGVERPVPLEFEYRETPIHESIAALLESERAPVYVVHFTQRAAVERAQDLMSVDFLSKDEKAEIKAATAEYRFDSPFGKDLRRYLHHGVGVHHAGLLPRYRLLVEKLTARGLLRIICGTDTLGVGVNVPIRSVLFTQLCKYDGTGTRVLTVRDFLQIAGRAGRKGFDDHGTVWVQAPEHVIENKQLEKKIAGDPSKKKKAVWKKPPERGYAHWDQATFEKLVGGTPETLTSSFAVSHAMVMQVLSRPDGCRALKALLRKSHERPALQRRHGRRAIAILRSLRDAGVLELAKDAHGAAHVEKSEVLQPEFSLNQALSPFVLHAVAELDKAMPDAEPLTRALAIVSIVESVLENPGDILRRQEDQAKTDALNAMKAEGMEYDERMAELEKIQYPKPLADFIYPTFNAWAKQHPWVEGENIRPKSVVRDMFELGATFHDYVREYGIARMEGTLLRYLSDAYKALSDSVPDAAKDEALDDIVEWLGAIVRQADASLLDEWTRIAEGRAEGHVVERRPRDEGPTDITANPKAFRALVRNELFRFVRALALKNYPAALGIVEPSDAWTPDALGAAMAPFFEAHSELRADPAVRQTEYTRFDEETRVWAVTQTLADPAGDNDWYAGFRVDLDASRERGAPVIFLDALGT